MHPFEIIEVDGPVAACNGGGGPLGHPRVYLNLGSAGRIECPYCSRLYVLRGKKPEAPQLPRTPGAPPTASFAQSASDAGPSQPKAK